MEYNITFTYTIGQKHKKIGEKLKTILSTITTIIHRATTTFTLCTHREKSIEQKKKNKNENKSL